MDVVDWLLESDAAIRWQVMRHLTDEPAAAVAAQRSEVATDGWGARFSFPPRWWYDVLRGVDYFRDAAAPSDARLEEALEMLEKKRTKDGRWNLQNHHSGREHFRMEQSGEPSRWNTLRALRVLEWSTR